jgi:membrane-associated protease RseP (regulator of RpoE activity)
MRMTTIALVVAMFPATVAANPDKNPDKNQKKPDVQSETRVEEDSFEWSSGQDSRLGVMVMGISSDLRTFFGAPRDTGLLVAQVAPDSAASRADIRVGDVITKLGPDKVTSATQILGAIEKLEGPQKVAIELVRDHKPVTVQATLGRARQPAKSGV